MGKRGIKSRTIKNKLSPIPHNNRGNLKGRKVRRQLIIFKKPNENGETQRTIYHNNYNPYQQGRFNLIKEAVKTEDEDILKKLTPLEREVYDKLLEQKEAENEGKDKK